MVKKRKFIFIKVLVSLKEEEINWKTEREGGETNFVSFSFISYCNPLQSGNAGDIINVLSFQHTKIGNCFQKASLVDFIDFKS